MTSVSPLSPMQSQVAVLDAAAFARVAEIARAAAGLAIPDSKRTMVQSRLARRLKATGILTFDQYLDHVQSSAGDAEREHMVSALTTNVSHFFREDHHFRTLQSDVLPNLLERARSGGRVRIWSAGCSTGQEPYTIAMMLFESEQAVGRLDVRILASDIDQKVLASARSGLFDERQIQSVPEQLRSRYFTRTHDTESLRANEKLRSLISFRQLNLMAAWPMRGAFDVIFCRNVVIYFSEETQAALWPRFHAMLSPGGWFFLGHSERIHDPEGCGFDTAGITTYRRRDAAAQNQRL